MTGPQLLIAAIVIALVIAFIITMLVVNSNAKKIIDTNTRLVENQNLLVELNKQQGSEIERRMNELEEQSSFLEQQKNELDEQKGMIEMLQRQQEELAFCGAIATVFTACDKDDDDSPVPTPTPQPETPTAYTVMLDFVMHEKTFDMMTVDFIYTDAKGKENTMKIDKSTSPNAQLTALEKDFFDNNPTLALWRNEETEQRYPGINDYLDSKHLKVYRVTLENVAVGTTLKTTALPHILDSFQPKEQDDYALMPVVLISRSNADKFMTAHTVSLSFFSAKNWDRLKERLNSKDLAVCMNMVEVY